MANNPKEHQQKILKIGDKFSSYREFNSKLKEYEKVVLSNYYLRDSKTLKTRAQKHPNGIAAKANKDLKYYCLRISCIKGGRGYTPKNSKRRTLTFKQGCQAGMFLKISGCKKYLEILELNEEHNHCVSKTLFQTLPHQRLNLPEDIKASTQEALSLKGNKKLIQSRVIEETGCLITLKDLTNLKSRAETAKKFSECIHILKDVYNCDVHISCDDQDHLLAIFFQDTQMKRLFDAYPEIIFVDVTYCMHNPKAATYLIMIEDSEGSGAVVAVGILLNESENTINWFIEKFKDTNASSTKVKVVMTDKDSIERTSLKQNFPDASLQIYLFHTLEIFKREVSQENMNLTKEESDTAKVILTKLAYAKSEDKYEEAYKQMKAIVPQIVADYYDENWHPFKDDWVLYLTFNYKLFLNTTTTIINQIESMRQKLKTVILKFSNLEDFVKNLFICINSSRATRNISNTIYYHKVSASLTCDGSVEDKYKRLLTNYAFQKVHHQIKEMKKCDNFQLNEINKCLAPSSEGLLEVTTRSCECLFWYLMGLPCCHILKLRTLLDLPLFDEGLCLQRWTRKYYESHHSFSDPIRDSSLQDESNIELRVDAPSTSSFITNQNSLTSHKKFKLMNDECLKISKLCSEVSSETFCQRLSFIKQLFNKWSNNDNPMLTGPDDEINSTNDTRQQTEDTNDAAHQKGNEIENSMCVYISDDDYPKAVTIIKAKGRPKDRCDTVISLKRKRGGLKRKRGN